MKIPGHLNDGPDDKNTGDKPKMFPCSLQTKLYVEKVKPQDEVCLKGV